MYKYGITGGYSTSKGRDGRQSSKTMRSLLFNTYLDSIISALMTKKPFLANEVSVAKFIPLEIFLTILCAAFHLSSGNF